MNEEKIDKLIEKKLNLSVPKDLDEAEFLKLQKTYMNVFKDITESFINNKVSLEDSLVILDAISTAVQLYIMEGIKIDDVLK